MRTGQLGDARIFGRLRAIGLAREAGFRARPVLALQAFRSIKILKACRDVHDTDCVEDASLVNGAGFNSIWEARPFFP